MPILPHLAYRLNICHGKRFFFNRLTKSLLTHNLTAPGMGEVQHGGVLCRNIDTIFPETCSKMQRVRCMMLTHWLSPAHFSIGRYPVWDRPSLSSIPSFNFNTCRKKQFEEAGWLVDFLHPTRQVTLYATMRIRWNNDTPCAMRPGLGPLQNRWYCQDFYMSPPTGQLCSPDAEQITFTFPIFPANSIMISVNVNLVCLGQTLGSQIGILSKIVYHVLSIFWIFASMFIDVCVYLRMLIMYRSVMICLSDSGNTLAANFQIRSTADSDDSDDLDSSEL